MTSTWSTITSTNHSHLIISSHAVSDVCDTVITARQFHVSHSATSDSLMYETLRIWANESVDSGESKRRRANNAHFKDFFRTTHVWVVYRRRGLKGQNEMGFWGKRQQALSSPNRGHSWESDVSSPVGSRRSPSHPKVSVHCMHWEWWHLRE